MKELKPYLQRSLTTSCPLNFLMNKRRKTRTRAQASNNFQFSTRNCPEWKEALNCYRERRRGLTFRQPLHVYMFAWFSQQPTLTFLHPHFAMGKLKYSMQAGSTETIFRISVNWSCLDFWQIPLQIVLEALLIFDMIYVHWICFQTRGTRLVLSELLASSKTPGGSPLNSSDRKCVLTENKQTSPECAI